MDKTRLSKEQSKYIYGIAILMMVYHHLFVYPAGEEFPYYSVPDHLVFPGAGQRLAWVCRLCIPLYAFLSGYGLMSGVKKEALALRRSASYLLQLYRAMLLRYFRFLLKFWLVFIVFVPLRLLLRVGTLIDAKTFLLSLLGLSNAYNTEWWYIAQYLMMLLLFPLLQLFLAWLESLGVYVRKQFPRVRRWHFGILWCAAGLLFLLFRNAPVFSFLIRLLDNGRFVFTLVFFAGMICAGFQLFELLRETPVEKLVPALGVLLVAGSLALRWLKTTDATYTKYDAFITAPLVFGLNASSGLLPPLKRVISFLGEHSTYMWLTHTFFCTYYFRSLIFMPGVSTLVFGLTVIVSLVTAVLLGWCYERIAALRKPA